MIRYDAQWTLCELAKFKLTLARNFQNVNIYTHTQWDNLPEAYTHVLHTISNYLDRDKGDHTHSCAMAAQYRKFAQHHRQTRLS